MSRRHLPSKSAPHFTTAEKLHKRRLKRKQGPSAVRRRENRKAMFTRACGCVAAQHGVIPCKEHAEV